MDEPVVVREAGEKGVGVFAARDFRPGEIILRFQGRVVHHDDLAAITPWEREHLGELTADTHQILPAPRCYLNHSCAPNAVSTNDAVSALRAIVAGEEITIDYRLNAHDDGDIWEMVCRCDALPTPHIVIGDFFTLPAETQARYLPYAPAFIREEYARRHNLPLVSAHPSIQW